MEPSVEGCSSPMAYTYWFMKCSPILNNHHKPLIMAADGRRVSKAQLLQLSLAAKMRNLLQALSSLDEEHSHIRHGTAWWPKEMQCSHLTPMTSWKVKEPVLHRSLLKGATHPTHLAPHLAHHNLACHHSSRERAMTQGASPLGVAPREQGVQLSVLCWFSLSCFYILLKLSWFSVE